ncbi:MAG: membrane protein insertase YidC [Flavobacteriales bacterium]|nr:membrane protein insertase YidC [Flavobacteriales bacterium]
MSAKGFDKNSIIGLVLIGAILLVFSILNSPSEEELKAQKEKEAQEKAKTEKLADAPKEHATVDAPAPDTTNTPEIKPDSTGLVKQDSLKNLETLLKYGAFAEATQGEEQNYVIENERVKVTLSNKGGRISSVELKGFHTYDSLPLMLFNADSSRFNIELTVNDQTGGTRAINTEDLFFEVEGKSFSVDQSSSKSISFKLYHGSKDRYLEYKYSLAGDSYLVDYEIRSVGFNDVISTGFPYYMNWSMYTPNQEKTIDNQLRRSTIYYKYTTGDIDYIFETKYEKEQMETNPEWIMFKQQYFNATLLSTDVPFGSDSDIETIDITGNNSKNYVKGMSANISIPFEGGTNESFKMQYYFGPNRHEDLAMLERDLEESLDYGWGIFGWTNMILIRPVFDFLNGFGLSIGWIILLLTLIIKTILFPITWKTYLSSAKMRVLKPEITELNEKYKNDAVKKQQATMALYRQTGVNPLAGCIPLLIQMPILFALFRFFPATFDLRQKSFLWAEDLSTYDSVYDLGFNIPMYGDHISLFTLLMAISMIFYTRINSQMTSGMGEGAMASQMKIMTWLMPIMMLFFFNSYAAGLSFYYLIANCITIAQQFVIRKWIVDEDKLHAKIQANKTKTKKKSGFAAKLEQRMKEAQEMQQKRKKR